MKLWYLGLKLKIFIWIFAKLFKFKLFSKPCGRGNCANEAKWSGGTVEVKWGWSEGEVRVKWGWSEGEVAI